MLDLLFSQPLAFLIIFPGLIFAITIHEFAHAYMADKLGDPTPRHQGRVTLDPRAHLDPLGTILMLLTRFGWGKPVEFDPYNFKEPIRDTALVALAGPASNVISALIIAGGLQLGVIDPNGWLSLVAMILIQINIVLAIFNLVPVYPLDGSKIITAILPRSSAHEYEEFMNRYGLFVLLFLIFPWNGASPISQLISPIIDVVLSILLTT